MVATEFLDGLLACGTTTALVFGSHFAPAMDVLFTEAEARGLNITAGLVLSDRILREDLLCTPERALAESRDLIERWHGKGRLRYAVTPRFSLSASEAILAVCWNSCRTPRRPGRHLVHLAHQREPGRGRGGRRPVPRVAITTWTPTTGTAW